jgi:phosphomannomutase/phosphoglucomutase
MNKNLPTHVFRAYDVRGIVDKDLTKDFVYDLGRSLGTMAQNSGVSSLNIGYDGRLHSPNIAKNLINGIISTGCNVTNIGLVATPILYFANYHLGNNSGVMITGSHNPPEYNGFKIVFNGNALKAEEIQKLKNIIIKESYIVSQGSLTQLDISEDYYNAITKDIKLSRKISIAVDAGNGAAGAFAPVVYRRLGAKVMGLHCVVDGTFPNHHPDPSKPENLEELIVAVKQTGSELGLAFDGDGDRLGVVTQDGQIIYPDRQLMLFATDILSKNPNGKIIFDVKSTSMLPDWIKQYGGEPIMCRTGHSYIKAKIKETGALMAAEMSGHTFFNDRWYGFDDAIYAGARLLELLSQVPDPSLVLNSLPTMVSTPELNIEVETDGEQHKVIEQLQKTAKFPKAESINLLDGIRVEYKQGFSLIRASNTTPCLVLRFEAKTQKDLELIKQEMYHQIEENTKIKVK